MPNPSFEPETRRWRPRAGAPSREVPSQICAALGQKQPFFAQNSPQTLGKTPKRRETVATLHKRLDFTVSKTPLVPFNSRICPRNGPKRHQKAPKSAQCAPAPRNQARAVSWATGRKTEFRGHLVHPQPPTFCGFRPSELPNEPRDPRTSGHLVEPEGSPAGARLGPTVGPPGSPGRKKRFFPKLFLDHLGCTNNCFEDVLSPWWRVLGDGKSQNALKMGLFGTKNGSKMGQKHVFSKNDRGPFGMLKQVVLPHFEPVATGFGSWKIPKCLDNGPFLDQKWVKNGSKTRFSKSDPAPFGMLN